MKQIYTSFVLGLLFFLVPHSLFGLDVSGSVTTNTIWASGEVNVTGDVTISASLTIEAGTRIVVADQAMITVDINGSIQSNGTAGNEVVFTAENPSTGWRGIFFDSGTGDDPSSSFEYTTFEYGNADAPINDFDPPERQGGAVFLKYHSNVSFFNCIFENNLAASYGGAINSSNSQLLLENCTFKSNQAGGYDGGGAVHIMESGGYELRIENCQFYNNSAYTGAAVLAEYAGGLTVSGSVFANNESDFGSAIVIAQSSSNDISFVSNTFANNLTHSLQGSAINILSYVENMLFVNNIFHNNRNGVDNLSNVIFDNEPLMPVFQNCFIEGGLVSVSGLPASYTWTEMEDGDPAFVSASSDVGLAADGSSADWQLSDQSPCINAGLEDVSGLGLPAYDFAGNSRIQQGRIDMGALESSFVPTSVVNRFDNVDFKLWYRRDTGQIFVRTDDHEYFTGALYNITGALVDDKRSGSFQTQMIFSAAKLNRGIYVVTLFRPNGKVLKVAKVVVD